MKGVRVQRKVSSADESCSSLQGWTRTDVGPGHSALQLSEELTGFFFPLSLLSLLISLIAHFFSCLATSLFHPRHPLHYPTHPQLFKYYFSPSRRPLFSPPPPFFSLSLSCHCLSVGILSTLSVVCVRYV